MGWVVKATPRPLYPRERLGTHCIGGWVGLQGQSRGVRKISTRLGFDSRTPKPVASRYTDCGILPPPRKKRQDFFFIFLLRLVRGWILSENCMCWLIHQPEKAHNTGKTKFMTCFQLLRVSAPGCHPYGVFQIKSIQSQHANTGTASSELERLKY